MECDCNSDRELICPHCGLHSTSYIAAPVDQTVGKPTTREYGILAELNDFKFSEEIKFEISQIYQKATGGKSKKSGPRRAIIYCCIIYVCKERKIIFDTNEYQKKLDLKKKEINKAMKLLDPIFGHQQVEITINDILLTLIKIFNMQESCLPELLMIYNNCSMKSHFFNGAKSETLAAGIVYYYLNKYLDGFNPEAYFRQSTVSKESILLVHAEIKAIIETKDDQAT